MTKKTLPCLRTAGLLLAMSANAQAAAIQGTAYEGFDYTAGTITPPNPVANVPALLNGGTGFNATGTADANVAWDAALGGGWGNVGRAAVAEVIEPPTPAVTAIIASPNGAGGPVREIHTAGLTIATSGYLTPTGLALKLDGAAGSAILGRHLGQNITEGTFYVSFLTNRTYTTNRSTNVAFFREGTELFAFGANGSSAGEQFFRLNWAGSGIVSPSLSGAQSAPTPLAWTSGETYLIVLKVEMNKNGNNDRITAWINPTDLANDYNNPIYLQDSRDIGTSITGFRPFAGNQATGGNTAIFDEFRFGPTFNSVLTATEPTPKPALAFTAQPVGATNIVSVESFVPTYTPISLTAAANLPGASLQWLRDGVAISGATTTTYTVAEPNITHAGTYTCRATYDTEEVTSTAAVVTVNAVSTVSDDDDVLPDAVEVLLKPFGFSITNNDGVIPDLVTRLLAIDFSVSAPGGTPAEALLAVQTANPNNPILPPVSGKFNLQVAIKQTTDLAVAFTDLTSATITGSNVTVTGNQVKVTLPAPVGARQFNRVSATAAP